MKTNLFLSITTVLSIFFYAECAAQTEISDSTIFIPTDTVSTDTAGYKVNDLSKLKKVDLTKIYLEQLTKIVYMLGKTSIKEGDVPNNKYTDNHWKVINKAGDKHNVVIMKMYTNIIPYSDRDDIIDSILFFQEIISKMSSI